MSDGEKIRQLVVQHRQVLRSLWEETGGDSAQAVAAFLTALMATRSIFTTPQSAN